MFLSMHHFPSLFLIIVNQLTNNYAKVVFDPSGVKKYQISISAKAITCPTFGGKDLDEVFVTSARGKDFVEGSDGGMLFRFQIPEEWGIKGRVSEAFGGEL